MLSKFAEQLIDRLGQFPVGLEKSKPARFAVSMPGLSTGNKRVSAEWEPMVAYRYVLSSVRLNLRPANLDLLAVVVDPIVLRVWIPGTSVSGAIGVHGDPPSG